MVRRGGQYAGAVFHELVAGGLQRQRGAADGLPAVCIQQVELALALVLAATEHQLRLSGGPRGRGEPQRHAVVVVGVGEHRQQHHCLRLRAYQLHATFGFHLFAAQVHPAHHRQLPGFATVT